MTYMTTLLTKSHDYLEYHSPYSMHPCPKWQRPHYLRKKQKKEKKQNNRYVDNISNGIRKILCVI
jgi:hypothetical protein